eukprot:1138421-Pyramimonas_sp.AAC.1
MVWRGVVSCELLHHEASKRKAWHRRAAAQSSTPHFMPWHVTGFLEGKWIVWVRSGPARAAHSPMTRAGHW